MNILVRDHPFFLSQTMREPIAGLFILGGLDRDRILVFGLAVLFLLAIATASTMKRRRFWRLSAQRLSGIRGRDWSAVLASIDVVSVVPQTEPVRGYAVETVGFLSTLTYFYRSPELQTGDYSRMFDNEKDAQAWAASFKGRTVTVRVDPSDPTRSVLREEDL
jgi:hypothetical protein